MKLAAVLCTESIFNACLGRAHLGQTRHEGELCKEMMAITQKLLAEIAMEKKKSPFSTAAWPPPPPPPGGGGTAGPFVKDESGGEEDDKKMMMVMIARPPPTSDLAQSTCGRRWDTWSAARRCVCGDAPRRRAPERHLHCWYCNICPSDLACLLPLQSPPL